MQVTLSRLSQLCIGFLCLLPSITSGDSIALRAARLFDGKSATLVSNAVIVVDGEKIRDLGSNLRIPANVKVIDLGDATLSPGFIDAHTHLTMDWTGDYNQRRLMELETNVSERAYENIAHARATLEAGFTSVRR